MKRQYALLLLFLVAIFFLPRCGHSADTCVTTDSMARTTVRISKGQTSGTAVFVNPSHIATVQHVADAILGNEESASVELFQVNPLAGTGYRLEQMQVRFVTRIPMRSSDDVAILELERPFPGAQIASVRTDFIYPDDPVMSIGFPGGRFRSERGKYLSGREYDFGDGIMRSEYHLRFFDSNNRIVMTPGASGSPVFDCDGRVVFLISNQLVGQKVVHCAEGDTSCEPKREEFELPNLPETATNLAVPAAGIAEFLQNHRREIR